MNFTFLEKANSRMKNQSRTALSFWENGICCPKSCRICDFLFRIVALAIIVKTHKKQAIVWLESELFSRALVLFNLRAKTHFCENVAILLFGYGYGKPQPRRV